MVCFKFFISYLILLILLVRATLSFPNFSVIVSKNISLQLPGQLLEWIEIPRTLHVALDKSNAKLIAPHPKFDLF